MKLYFIQDANLKTVKIGKSTDPKRRLSQLQSATSIRLKIIFAIDEIKGVIEEKIVHYDLRKWRLSGEWYENGTHILEKIIELKQIKKIATSHKRVSLEDGIAMKQDGYPVISVNKSFYVRKGDFEEYTIGRMQNLTDEQMTIQDVMRYTSLNRNIIVQMLKNGLSYKKISGFFIIDRKDVDRYLKTFEVMKNGQDFSIEKLFAK